MTGRNREWKHLLLWRHAEAEDEHEGGNLARRLTAHGKTQAQAVAAWLWAQQKHEVLPQTLRIFASPATRAQQTVAALEQPFITDPRLAPGTPPEDYFKVAGWNEVRIETEDETETSGATESAQHGKYREQDVTLIVGHQPTLGRVAAHLMTQQKAVWSIRKSALWWFAQRRREGIEQNILLAVIDAQTATAAMR